MSSAPSISMRNAAVFAILGSGFGMYGYLPALIECGMRVALPERYRSVVGGRSELVQYMPEVVWCAGTEDALARASGAVIALRPADQATWIPRLARMPQIRDLILEKPVAPTPAQAASLLEELDCFGKRYRIGYTFGLLPWVVQLRRALGGKVASIALDWTFLAHHYRADLQNWKRFDQSGGGAVRFYGIHLIALLADCGYDDVSVSLTRGPSDAETAEWEATFTGKAVPPFALRVDTRAGQTRFAIVSKKQGDTDDRIVDQPDPFSSIAPPALHVRDPRVDVLVRLCRSLQDEDENERRRQRRIVALWTKVEARSRRVIASVW
jgi:predicted dehydrogenase